MGFFEDEDLASADTDPFAIPDGSTEVTVTEAKVVTTKAGEPCFVITFTAGKKSHSEWLKSAKYAKSEQAAGFARSHAKKVLTSLGVAASELNSVEPEDLIGITGVITLYTRKGYKSFGSFKVLESGGTGSGLVTGEPDFNASDLNKLASVGTAEGADFFS